MSTYQGSCHCGRVAFELQAQVDTVIDCNCVKGENELARAKAFSSARSSHVRPAT